MLIEVLCFVYFRLLIWADKKPDCSESVQTSA